MSKGWIGVDLDKTLAFYADWGKPIGKPIPKMMRRVKQWLKDGRDVRIVTARADKHSEISKIQDWCEKHGLPRLPVTNRKDHDMEVLYDDRARQVTPNKGEIVGERSSSRRRLRFSR